MLASAVHQREPATGIHTFPLSWTSLPPLTLSYPFRLSQSPSVSHTANSHWLSTLHTVTYMFPSYSLHPSHPLLPSPLTMSTMFTFDEGLTILTGFSKLHSHLNLKTFVTCYKQGTKSNIRGVYKLNILFLFLRMYLWGCVQFTVWVGNIFYKSNF